MKKIFLLATSALICASTFASAPDFEIPDRTEEYNTMTAEQIREDNATALKAAQYFFTTELPADKDYALDAVKFALLWASKSDDIKIDVDHDLFKQFSTAEKKDVTAILFGAYICGCVAYDLDGHISNEFTLDMNYNAVKSILGYYKKNREYFGKIPGLDKWQEMDEKGELRTKFEKKFAKEED